MLETLFDDFSWSHAFDLLNSRNHVFDKDFALDEGLLPINLSQGKIKEQFARLAEIAGIGDKIFNDMMTLMLSRSSVVEKMIAASYLDDSSKKEYWQLYNGGLKQLAKD